MFRHHADTPQGGFRPPDPIGGLSTREQSTAFFNQAEMMGDLQMVVEMANRYNVTLYIVDPRGLAPLSILPAVPRAAVRRDGDR